MYAERAIPLPEWEDNVLRRNNAPRQNVKIGQHSRTSQSTRNCIQRANNLQSQHYRRCYDLFPLNARYVDRQVDAPTKRRRNALSRTQSQKLSFARHRIELPGKSMRAPRRQYTAYICPYQNAAAQTLEH